MKNALLNKYALASCLACACFGLAPRLGAEGTVYAMTNALGNNQILVYHRADNGMLSLIQTVATTGGGSGVQLDATDSLGSQGSLILDHQHQRLFAANTETLAAHSSSGPTVGDCQEGSISSFLVGSNGMLTFAAKTPSGGLFPNSLTINPLDNLLYVLNAGGPGINPVCGQGPNITGFTLGQRGQLKAIANSTMPINPGSSPGSFLTCDPGVAPFSTYEFQCGLNPPAFPRSPAEVSFDRLGILLVVTEKGTNSIYMFPMDLLGRPKQPIITKAAGPTQPTYFGFTFDLLDHVIVAEPFGNTSTIPVSPATAASSFFINRSGYMSPISSNVIDDQGTGCWMVLAGGYAFVSNNGSGTISSYKLGLAGGLSLLNASAATVNRPNEMAVAPGVFGSAGFLYVLEGGAGTVGVFQISANGSLTSLQSAPGLPVAAGAQGLAAY